VKRSAGQSAADEEITSIRALPPQLGRVAIFIECPTMVCIRTVRLASANIVLRSTHASRSCYHYSNKQRSIDELHFSTEPMFKAEWYEKISVAFH
jgi:hypothetical protein